jgi:hypothetical protein
MVEVAQSYEMVRNFNNFRAFIIVLFVETPRKFICSNKFTWCFHKQNNYIFNRHANIQITYFRAFVTFAVKKLEALLILVEKF